VDRLVQFYRQTLPAYRAVLLALVGFAPAVAAFHDAGVASCAGCHTMHNSQDGTPIDPGIGHEMLLLYESATDLCLSCHADENGSVLGTDPIAPPPERGGGNFVFLYEDDLNDLIRGPANPITGNHAGHNVASLSWGIPVDPDHPVAPGGDYPAADLGCTSCHDPHGNSEFRMLRGAGSTDAAGFAFTSPAPLAQGIPLTGAAESTSLHTAYQRGWAAWCANCHGYYHEEGPGFDHPDSETLGSDERDTYNRYAGPDNPFGGSFATAYIPELPLEDPTRTTTSTVGAGSSSRLTCMSCHRAHATSAPKGLRWDPNVVILKDDGSESGSYPLPSPYPDPRQRSLCVKCHYEDANHGFGRSCMTCHRYDH
jgi:predicted CXXCH cytochrome family protein